MRPDARHAGVGDDERQAPVVRRDRVPEGALVDVRQVDEHPPRVQRCDRLAAGGRQALVRAPAPSGLDVAP